MLRSKKIKFDLSAVTSIGLLTSGFISMTSTSVVIDDRQSTMTKADINVAAFNSDLCVCDNTVAWQPSSTPPVDNDSSICVFVAEMSIPSTDAAISISVTCRPMISNDTVTIVTDDPTALSTSLMAGPHLWALVLFLFPALTVFGNMLVVLSVFRERSLRTATNYFIVSLAVADIMVAILVMPLAVYVEVNDSNWELGDALCDVWVACDVMCCTASILNLTAISVDRFIAVTRPLSYARHKNSHRVFVMLGLTWIVSIAVSSPIVLGANYTDRRLKHPGMCTFYNSDFLIYSSMASFYVPCIAMIALYWRIFRAIRRRERKTSVQQTSRKMALPIDSRRHLQQSSTVSGHQNTVVQLHSSPTRPPLTSQMVLDSRRKSRAVLGASEDEVMNVSSSLRQMNTATNCRNSLESEGLSTAVVQVEGSATNGWSAVLPQAFPVLLVPPGESDEVDGVLDRLPMPFLRTTTQSMHSLALLIRRSSTIDDDQIASITSGPGGGEQTTTGHGDDPQSVYSSPNIIRKCPPTVQDSSTVRALKPTGVTYASGSQSLRPTERAPNQLLQLSGDTETVAVVTSDRVMPAGSNCDRNSAATNRQTLARRARRDKNASKREKKATKTLAIVLGVFLLCWVPFFTLNIINAICLRYDLFDVIALCQIDLSFLSLSVWLGYINSFLNPVIYTIFNIEFRRAFNKLLQHPCA